MKKFENIFVKVVNPSFMLKEEKAEKDVSVENAQIIDSLYNAALARDFESFNAANSRVLDMVHGGSLGTKILSLKSHYQDFMNTFKMPLQNITKDLQSLSTEGITDNESDDQPETTNDQPTKEIQQQRDTLIKQQQSKINEAMTHPLITDIKSVFGILGSNKMPLDTSKFANILSQPERNTLGLSKRQIEIIRAYNNNVDKYEQMYGAQTEEVISNALGDIENRLQETKTESVITFKKYLSEDALSDWMSDLATPVVKGAIKTAKTASDLVGMLKIKPVYKFLLGTYLIALLPSILDLILQKLPELVSKLFFPLGGFVSKIIVVGNPEGIDPAKDVDRFIESTVGLLITPIKSAVNNIKNIFGFKSIFKMPKGKK